MPFKLMVIAPTTGAIVPCQHLRTTNTHMKIVSKHEKQQKNMKLSWKRQKWRKTWKAQEKHKNTIKYVRSRESICLCISFHVFSCLGRPKNMKMYAGCMPGHGQHKNQFAYAGWPFFFFVNYNVFCRKRDINKASKWYAGCLPGAGDIKILSCIRENQGVKTWKSKKLHFLNFMFLLRFGRRATSPHPQQQAFVCISSHWREISKTNPKFTDMSVEACFKQHKLAPNMEEWAGTHVYICLSANDAILSWSPSFFQ